MSRSNLKIIIAFFCILIAVSYFGPRVEAAGREKGALDVSAALDKESAAIGDKIKYTITVVTAKDTEVQFPEFDETLGGLTIKDFGSSERDSFRKKTLLRWYLLDTYLPGEYTIPKTVVKYKTVKDTDWLESQVNEVKIEIKSLLETFPDASDIRDIKGPISFPAKVLFSIIVTLMALLLLAAVIKGVILAIKKTREKEEFIPPKLPHEVAYERFEELKNKDLIASGKIKEFYIELSDILRHYIEDRFGLRAPEMTTEEFLQKAKDTGKLKTAHKNILREFLFHCDLVKFAKYGPSEEEIESSFESSVKLVDQTKEEEKAVELKPQTVAL